MKCPFLPLCCGEKLIKPRLPYLPKKIAASFALFFGIRQTIKNDAEPRPSGWSRSSRFVKETVIVWPEIDLGVMTIMSVIR
jgi:hypothetical protein